MKHVGSCDRCKRSFEYELIHNGFNDSAYAYCDTCGCTAMISGWRPAPEGTTLRVHQQISKDIEELLEPCRCGGHFTANASPRCPYCKSPLSAVEAATWIEANAPGASKGWRWQRDWAGLYCIIVQENRSSDPWRMDLARSNTEFVTLFRPVGPDELGLIQAIDFCGFPPRLPEQPLFYPVLTEAYASKIARDWNVPASGSGYVTRFTVRRAFLSRYEIHNAGGENFREYWIPAEDIDEFNRNIVGKIELIKKFPADDDIASRT
jgi:hypothetical protein